MIRTTTLENGLRVATDKIDHVETVALGVWLNIGTRHEKKSENGIAHMLEHMAFKGTLTRSALDISKAIEDVGGYMNAYTSREMTAYYVRVLRKDVELAVDILADILQHSVFDAEEFSREQGVILQEIGRSNDTPDDVVFDYFQETCFGDHPMGWATLGTEDIIKSLTPAAVKSYMDRHYGVKNMVFSAAGHIDHDQLCKLVGKYFTKLSDKGDQTPLPASYRGGDFRKSKELEQVHVVLGLPTVNVFDPTYYDYMILASILGGGMASWLFHEIREKRGLVYTISADQYSYSDAGMLTIYAGTSPKEVGQLLPVVCDELKKATHTITEEEVNRAKNQMQAGLLMGLESTSHRCERLAKQMHLFNRPIPMEEILEKINRVSVQSVQNSCQSLLSGRPTLTTLGLIDQVMSFEELETGLAA
ncbi:MAG: M16 family metallopeptidase [Pseudomonadota bacterium]|jgi:predicted Zn-dependent peptidase|nr:insulinase family protein [Alphaproteobacteria bacterium]